MRPKGQVTLVCDRSRLETIDFLVVDVPGDKPPLLSGKDAQAHQRHASSNRQSGNTTLPGNVPIPVQILTQPVRNSLEEPYQR